MVKIIIEYKSMAQTKVAFAQSVGIRITGMSKYAPVVYADATSDQIVELQQDINVKRVTYDAPIGTMEKITTPAFEEFSTDFQTQLTESVDIIKARDAWAKGYTGNGIKIAIVDTGIWEAHPWMAGKVIARWSAFGDDAQDRQSHGTHVAGIASTIAPDAKLINIKVIGDDGYGSFSSIMQGVEKAADLGADVINMSLGGDYHDCFDGDPLDIIITHLSQNIVFCISAGNAGSGSNTIAYPGSSRKAVCCGAVDKGKNIAYFSSRGPSGCGEIKPDISAPGVGIVSSIPPDGTASYNGTSMAAPMISGAMAILRQKAFFSDRTIIEDILKAGGGGEKNNNYGWGVIDVSKALDAMILPTDKYYGCVNNQCVEKADGQYKNDPTCQGTCAASQADMGYVLLAGLGIAVVWGLMHRKKM